MQIRNLQMKGAAAGRAEVGRAHAHRTCSPHPASYTSSPAARTKMHCTIALQLCQETTAWIWRFDGLCIQTAAAAGVYCCVTTTVLKHLHNLEMRVYCPQTFPYLDFQCRDDVSELKYMFRFEKSCLKKIIRLVPRY